MNIINSIQSSLCHSLPWSLVDDHLLNLHFTNDIYNTFLL